MFNAGGAIKMQDYKQQLMDNLNVIFEYPYYKKLLASMKLIISHLMRTFFIAANLYLNSLFKK